VFGALRAGASGFLLKDTPPADLLTAIRVVAAGEALLAPSVTRRLIDEFTRNPAPRGSTPSARGFRPTPASAPGFGPTPASAPGFAPISASAPGFGPTSASAPGRESTSAPGAGAASALAGPAASDLRTRADQVTRALTGREREVLCLVAAGLSNAEIAGRLYISHATAKTHVAHLLTKLDARDRVQLVIIAYQSGLGA
jgi:DNA-binding NarL/FixJ family response regulator